MMRVFHRSILKDHLKASLWFLVYVPTAVIGAGKLVDLVAGFERFGRHDPVSVFASFLIVGGTALIFRAARDLEVLGYGTASPKAPPKRLVTEDVYALCRHPMSLGYNIAAFGVLLILGSPGALFVSYPVMIYLGVRFLRKEEREIDLRFGKEYQSYREQTAFLLPFVKWPSGGSEEPKK